MSLQCSHIIGCSGPLNGTRKPVAQTQLWVVNYLYPDKNPAGGRGGEEGRGEVGAGKQLRARSSQHVGDGLKPREACHQEGQSERASPEA